MTRNLGAAKAGPASPIRNRSVLLQPNPAEPGEHDGAHTTPGALPPLGGLLSARKRAAYRPDACRRWVLSAELGVWALAALLAMAAVPLPRPLAIEALALSLLGLGLMVVGLRRQHRHRPAVVLQPLHRAVLAPVAALAAVLLLLATVAQTEPLLWRWFDTWLLGGGAAWCFCRLVAEALVRRLTATQRLMYRLAVVGEADDAAILSAALQRGAPVPTRVVATVNLPAAARAGAPPNAAGAPATLTAADIAVLAELADREAVDALVLAPSAGNAALAGLLHDTARGLYRHVYTLAALPPDMATSQAPFGPSGLPLVRTSPAGLTAWQRAQKSVFDRVAGLVLVLMLMPVLIAIAVALKLDSRGPVLFRQPRVGLDNRSFTVFKFRSMYHHLSDVQAARQTSRDDPRVTRLGRVLRRLSLDELPQLLNVLRGDMSLVGPRPHTPHTAAEGIVLEDAVLRYRQRHWVKPGITGWAQVSGERGEIVSIAQIERRVQFDLDYIRNWSLGLDIRILLMTVMREFISKRAF